MTGKKYLREKVFIPIAKNNPKLILTSQNTVPSPLPALPQRCVWICTVRECFLSTEECIWKI